jgi:hypothetical protein
MAGPRNKRRAEGVRKGGLSSILPGQAYMRTRCRYHCIDIFKSSPVIWYPMSLILLMALVVITTRALRARSYESSAFHY